MATYKLTTIATFTDNTCSEDPDDLQRYVDKIRDDLLGNWDTAEVICDVNGQVFTSKGEGNRRESTGDGSFTNHPWHRLSDELPLEGLHVLFYDLTGMHMGWVSRRTPEGYVARDGDLFVFLEDYNDDGYWELKDVKNWWWRKVEAPAALNELNKEEKSL